VVEDYRGTWLGGEVRVVWTPWPSWRLTAGGELQLHPPVTLEGGADVPYVNVHEPYSAGAGYGVAEGLLLPWLRLSAGALLDINTTFGPIGTTRVATIVKPWSGGALKLMGGSAFRAPSIFEQYYSDGIGQLPAIDPARDLTLSPESTLSGEVELSHRFAEDWVALVAGHASRISDLITTAPDSPGAQEVRNVNRTSPALTAGAEIELRKEWRQGWMLSASYSYQHAEYEGTGARLINVPEHLSSARAVVPIIDERVIAGLRVTLEAPRPISVEDDARTRGSVVADVTVSGELRRFHARYVLGVYNLMDAVYDNPVKETFLSRTSRQSGRTLLADLVLSYP
jgi:outer membrane cobalamin receptor